MANLRGLSARAGNRKKQIIKQVAAARLNAPKISSRSHLLTVVQRRVSIDAQHGQGDRIDINQDAGGWLHGANACDKNGCAGTRTMCQARVLETGSCINTAFCTHVQTNPLPLLGDWEPAGAPPGSLGLEASHCLTGRTGSATAAWREWASICWC